MIYGFLDNDSVVVVAADTWLEFESVLNALRTSSLETEFPSALDLITKDLFKGMHCHPLIVQAPQVRGVRLLDRADAIERQRLMMESPDSDEGAIDEMLLLYTKSEEGKAAAIADDSGAFISTAPGKRSQQAGKPLSAQEAMISDNPVAAEFLFVTYALHDIGTVALITSAAYYGDDDHRIYHTAYGEAGRIRHYLSHLLPSGFGDELVPGCFEFRGSPLQAKRLLLAAGFTYDEGYANNVIAGSRVSSEGNSADEVASEMGLSMPVSPADFVLGICAHPERDTSFVTIIARPVYEDRGHRCLDTFIDPLVERLLPQGFGEIAPGVFEVLRPIDRVRTELTSAGFVEDEDASDLIDQIVEHCPVLSTENTSADGPEATSQEFDWDKFLERLPEMTSEEVASARAFLRAEDILFTTYEAGGSTYLVMTPRDYYVRNGTPIPADLGLGSMIMPQAQHIIGNAFVFRGIGSNPVTAMMVKNGFQESFNLSLWLNMALHDGFAEVLGITI